MIEWFKNILNETPSKCIECHYLAKYKSDSMGGIADIESLNWHERKQIERDDFNSWLRSRDHLGCYQGVWEENIKEQNRSERLFINRPRCLENNWYREYEAVDISLAQMAEDQENNERVKNLFKKVKHGIELQPGWVYGLIIFIVTIILAFQDLRELILSYFGL